MKILIMGRANVGKSSLFNRLIKKRKSLVINEPGITRDLLHEKTKWWGQEFELIDSGGLADRPKKDELSQNILKKIKTAIGQADAFIVVVDGKAGLCPEDAQAVQMARQTGKAFIIFVNKIDKPNQTPLLTAPFFKLSAHLLSGSLEQNYGVDEVVEWIISQKQNAARKAKLPTQTKSSKLSLSKKENESLSSFAKTKSSKPSPSKKENESLSSFAKTQSSKPSPSKKENESLSSFAKTNSSKLSPSKSESFGSSYQANSLELSSKPEKEITKLFVMGRANSGKSLLCNQILQTDRLIVSSKPGTTLDTVTEFFSRGKNNYSLADNPGSRRGNRAEREKISFAKSRSELKTADIALLVLPANEGPSRQDARLIQLCLEKSKPILLVVNKMDLLKNLSPEEKQNKQEEIKRIFHFYPDLPMVFISAKTGYHKDKLFNQIEIMKQKINFRVSTSELNRFFMKVIRQAPSPVYGTSDVKFYYISQTNKKPPEFIAFANYPKGVTPAYNRFIINKIKEQWSLKGIPIAFQALPKR